MAPNFESPCKAFEQQSSVSPLTSLGKVNFDEFSSRMEKVNFESALRERNGSILRLKKVTFNEERTEEESLSSYNTDL